jgi:four helix bundle protein
MDQAVRSYQDLIVWQKAMELVTKIYRVSNKFPRDEIFALTNQLRRAAISVPSNIAEGQGRSSTKEFVYFLGNAKGSLSEVETQLLIARNLDYISDEDLDSLLDLSAEAGRILNGLLTSLRGKK